MKRKIDNLQKSSEIINIRQTQSFLNLANNIQIASLESLNQVIDKIICDTHNEKKFPNDVHIAAYFGCIEWFHQNHYAKVINSKNSNDLTLLHITVRKNFVEITKFLLEDPNILVNELDASGWSPLHYAAIEKHIESGNLLLKHDKIIVNIKSNNQLTPLHCAAISGYNPMIRVLVEAGAEKNSTDSTGATPLHKVAAMDNRIKAIKLMIKLGFDVNVVDYKQASPLHLAVVGGLVSNVKLLLSAPDINVNILGIHGIPPLHMAIYKDSKIASLLLTHPKINIHIRDDSGLTALDKAKKCNNFSIIEQIELLEGTNINSVQQHEVIEPEIKKTEISYLMNTETFNPHESYLFGEYASNQTYSIFESN